MYHMCASLYFLKINRKCLFQPARLVPGLWRHVQGRQRSSAAGSTVGVIRIGRGPRLYTGASVVFVSTSDIFFINVLLLRGGERGYLCTGTSAKGPGRVGL